MESIKQRIYRSTPLFCSVACDLYIVMSLTRGCTMFVPHSCCHQRAPSWEKMVLKCIFSLPSLSPSLSPFHRPSFPSSLSTVWIQEIRFHQSKDNKGCELGILTEDLRSGQTCRRPAIPNDWMNCFYWDGTPAEWTEGQDVWIFILFINPANNQIWPSSNKSRHELLIACHRKLGCI